MDGEGELLPNETLPDGSQQREQEPRVMTTSLSGNQPISTVSVIGSRV